MARSPKIFVWRIKELAYTLIFVLLAILLIFFAVRMFSSDDAQTSYIPGVYTTGAQIGGHPVLLSLCVDASMIRDVSLQSADESITVSYPLVEPVLSELRLQLLANQSPAGIRLPQTGMYTARALLDLIEKTLEKAAR